MEGKLILYIFINIQFYVFPECNNYFYLFNISFIYYYI